MAEKKKVKKVEKKSKHINEKTSNKKLSKKKAEREAKKIGKKYKKNGKMKFKYKHPVISIIIRLLIILFLLVAVVGAGVVIGLFYGLWGDELEMDFEQLAMASNSVIVDSSGENVIADLKGDESRKIITLEEMSKYLPKAYVAIEDERFEKHSGVDLLRTGKAIFTFVTHGGKSSFGGSTITQQLVKNATEDDERSGIEGITRKIKEWAKAYQIEQVMSKDQILETYLNTIFVGGKSHGVELGAKYYFNKPASELTLAECAFLAGINSSPNYYNPYSHPDRAEKANNKAKTVIGKMLELQYISKEEYDGALTQINEGYKFEDGTKNLSVYSSHTDALLAQVIAQIAEEKGISQSAAKDYLYTSGLTIYSTQVANIQTKMEEEAKESKYEWEGSKLDADGKKQKTQAAMVVIEPSTGYVVGCIGNLGEKTASGSLNRATQSTMSPGSSFKPLADLTPGFEEGVITPATIYYDVYTVFNTNGVKYDPQNYNGFSPDDNPGRSIRSATATSQNIPFIKVMAEIGNAKCTEYLKKFGISTLDAKEDAGLSAAIGGLYKGVKVVEMAAAYAALSNNGEYIEPTFYTKVVDSNGKAVLEPNQERRRVCSEDTAYMVKDVLTSVVTGAGATASYCKINGIDVAAKTGTTNESKDRWLCGFTNYYAAATWYGYDQPERITKKGTNPAGLLWSNVMKDIHKGKENSKFEKTANIINATVCRTSGLLATDKCTDTYSEVFIKGKLPQECDAHTNNYTVCTETGLLANEYCKNTEPRSTGYVVEKEKLGLWNSSVTIETEKPTVYCTTHKKVEVIIPEKPTTSDSNNTNTNTTTGGTTNTTGNNNSSGNTSNSNENSIGN